MGSERKKGQTSPRISTVQVEIEKKTKLDALVVEEVVRKTVLPIQENKLIYH